jgi:Cu/Ag efflux protein CusF
MFSKMGRPVGAVLWTVALTLLLSAEQAHAQGRGRGRPQPPPPQQNPEPKTAVVSGAITTINGGSLTITPATGAAVTVNVTSDTKIVRNGQPAALTDLQKNDRAKAVYNAANNNALLLEAHVKVTELRGTITAIGTNTVAITPTTGAAVTVNVTSDTKIIRNRQPATLADLQENDKVEVSYDSNNNAVVIEAHIKTSEVRGTITAINGAAVTVTPATGAAVTVNVTADTKVLRNGQPAALTDLQKTDRAKAVYNAANNNALVLEAHVKVTEVRGTITAIGANTVTITSAAGAAVTVNITADTKIVRNRQPATLADLKKNDKAEASYDSNNNAVVLEVRGS